MADSVLKRISFSPAASLQNRGGLAFFLFVIGFVAWLFSAAINWMTDANRLPLSQLVIQGELHYLTPGDVREGIMHLEQLGSFMTQDVDDIQHALEAMPWVARAAVRKQWPDTLKVFIGEQDPAASWNGHNLVNQDGEVFEASPDQAGQLLVGLAGPEGTSLEVLSALHEMQPRLQHAGFEIATLALNERRAWRVWLTNGVRLELGRKERMERIERFIALSPQLEQQGQAIEYIDLRYDTGAAVGWVIDPDQSKTK
ncbi:cell division protein FtsQ/DivIB [Photobacterium sp. DNB23_23_1]|uniref:Cell division protein FtsQ n=1 Tax=Photobacterium pectinilyticum TaxID=2906793 RepID=A0ABT1MZD1_9GAMM|nr:cell division protein FtsQ/DivIB [Photobacterium sp. ZSDE20]MCQ1057192.1 cell division protein FtsQ/DivIB [Photobacterium sp. ZSDE20]MDD1821327.1 cell division protein FtsQ/DivIB [Photobacterium sp. ZSDE20]